MGSFDCLQSLDTLYDVLFSMVKMMAPFTPFITEHIYQRLVLFQPQTEESSIHLQMIPSHNPKWLRPDVENSVALMQSVIELGRIMRDRRTLPLKYPVRGIIIIHKDELCLQQIKSLENFIISELNVRKITLSSDRVKYGVTMRAEAEHKLLGQRLKSTFKAVLSTLKKLSHQEIQAALEQGFYEVCGERLELAEVRVIYGVADSIGEHFEALSDNEILLLMDMQQDAELMEEGLAREVINRIQKLKKRADLIPTDVVKIYYDVQGEDEKLREVMHNYKEMIINTVKSSVEECKERVESAGEFKLIEEMTEIKGVKVKLEIYANDVVRRKQKVGLINLMLAEDLEARFGAAKQTTILLENEKTGEKITWSELKREIQLVFGLFGVEFFVFRAGNCGWELFESNSELPNNSVLYVTRKRELPDLNACEKITKNAFKTI